MMIPASFGLLALRWQPFKLRVDFPGYDFTGAAFAMQVRSYRDAPDPALISLTNAVSPAQGISVSVATTEGIPTSSVEVRIDEATLECLPFTNPRGTDLEVVWDFVITPAGGVKSRWFEGRFIVHGGSTQI